MSHPRSVECGMPFPYHVTVAISIANELGHESNINLTNSDEKKIDNEYQFYAHIRIEINIDTALFAFVGARTSSYIIPADNIPRRATCQLIPLIPACESLIAPHVNIQIIETYRTLKMSGNE